MILILLNTGNVLAGAIPDVISSVPIIDKQQEVREYTAVAMYLGQIKALVEKMKKTTAATQKSWI